MEVPDFREQTTPILELEQLENDVRAFRPSSPQRKRSRNSTSTNERRNRRDCVPFKTPRRSTAHIRKVWRQLHLDILKVRVRIAEVNLEEAKINLLEDDYQDRQTSNNKRVRRWVDNVAAKSSSGKALHASPVNQFKDTGSKFQNKPILSPRDRRHRIEELEKELQHLKNQEHSSELLSPKQFTNSVATINKPVRPLPRLPDNLATTQKSCSLPMFSGASDEWLNYKTAYDSTKQNFNDFSNAERIKKSLTGEALALNGHMMSTNNPDYLIRGLEKMFGRPENIAYAEAKQLSALPMCTESAKDIRIFAEKIKVAFMKFKALNMDCYITNPDLLLNLKAKLPLSLRRQWYKILIDTPNADLTKFIDFLVTQADARMMNKPRKGYKSSQRPLKRPLELNEKGIKLEPNDMPKETQ